MDEIVKVFIGAILAFAFAILLKLAVEPVFALRQAIGKLVGTMYEHKGMYLQKSRNLRSPDELENEMNREFNKQRDHSVSAVRASIGAVYGAVEVVSFYWFWVLLRTIPRYRKIQHALSILTGLINGNGDALSEQEQQELKGFGVKAKTGHEAISKLLNTRIPHK